MESIAVHKVNTRKSATNNRNILKKLARLSFDADAVYESKDWPYLWPKTNSARPATKAARTEAEIAERRARMRQIGKISCWGIVSVAMYLGLFFNQGAITNYFTRGGFFALAVVATALAFALVHGTFAGHVLENMNFRAANRRKDEH